MLTSLALLLFTPSISPHTPCTDEEILQGKDYVKVVEYLPWGSKELVIKRKRVYGKIVPYGRYFKVFKMEGMSVRGNIIINNHEYCHAWLLYNGASWVDEENHTNW